MSIIITDACINCMACIVECPNTAIYDPTESWNFAEGTKLKGKVVDPKGKEIDTDEVHPPVSTEFVYIVADKCTTCVGFHETPQCAAACPVDCCVPDENNPETEEECLEKQRFLHKIE